MGRNGVTVVIALLYLTACPAVMTTEVTNHAAFAVPPHAPARPALAGVRPGYCPQRRRIHPASAGVAMMAAGKAPLNSETLSIGVGGVSLTALLINRLATEELANAQGRADILGLAVCSALLLTALSTIDLKVREKESVELAGVVFDEVLVPMSADREQNLRWAAGAISRVCENAKSVAVYSNGQTVARLGIMGREQTVQVGPIAESALKSEKQQYLADLQILPGRFEFSYLPINTQAILIQPLGPRAFLVVGADKVRPFTGRDINMMNRIALVAAESI